MPDMPIVPGSKTRNAALAGVIASVITAMGAGYTTFADHHTKELQLRLEDREKLAEMEVDLFAKTCVPVFNKDDEKSDRYEVCKRQEQDILNYGLNAGRYD